MRTVPIKIYSYTVLVLHVQPDGSAKKEETQRFRVIARTCDEAEAIAIDLARLGGATCELLATATKVGALEGRFMMSDRTAG